MHIGVTSVRQALAGQGVSSYINFPLQVQDAYQVDEFLSKYLY